MKLSEILVNGVPNGFSYFIDGVKVIMVAPRHRGIDVFTISSKKYCFEDQSIEAGEVVGGLGLAAFWIYDKEGSGCTLRVVVERTVTVEEIVAAKRDASTAQVEDVNKDKHQVAQDTSDETTRSFLAQLHESAQKKYVEVVDQYLAQQFAQHANNPEIKPNSIATEPNLVKEKAMSSTQKETKEENLIQKLKQDVAQHGYIKLSTMLGVTKSCGGHVTLAGMFCNFKQWCHLFEARVSEFQEVPTTFNDQPVELKAYQRQCNFGFSTSVKTVTGHHREISFLSIDKDIALELDKIISSQGRSTLDKPSDQTELVRQLQKRLDELEKTVADLKKESTDEVKLFKFSDLFDHISSTTGYRIYLGDNEITGYHNTPVSGIVLYDGKRLVAEFDNQQLIPLEHPSTGLMSYNVLATDGEYYNLRVTGEQVANEEEYFSK